jgi:hypothetical protein
MAKNKGVMATRTLSGRRNRSAKHLTPPECLKAIASLATALRDHQDPGFCAALCKSRRSGKAISPLIRAGSWSTRK